MNSGLARDVSAHDVQTREVASGCDGGQDGAAESALGPAVAAASESGGEPSAEEREARFQAQVWSNLRRNYTAHLIHGMLGQTGFRLFQTPTFLPTYIALLSGSVAWVGVVRGLQGLGQCLTPFFSATLVEQRRRVLPLGFVIGGLMRIQFLGIALAGFFLPDRWNLIAVCVFTSLFGFFLGMQGVVFNTLMSKVIPVERRGALTGARNALAGVVVFFVGGLGGRYLIEPNALGNGYATTFLVAFLLTAAGLATLMFTREPEAPAVRAATRVSDRILDIPEMLRSDPDFRWYFIARAIATMGRMALPFYVLFVQQNGQLSGWELGVLTGAFALAQSSLNLPWGLLADRAGFRAVFLMSLVIWIGSVAVLLTQPTFAVLVAVYVGIGAGLGGFMMASMNIVLEFGKREDVPLRIALANSSSELVGSLATISAGFFAQSFGYEILFIVAILFKLAALASMWRVREPRFRLDSPA